MRLTIIPEDKMVKIDGVAAFDVDMAGVDPAIHAVQWYDTYGEIEWKSTATTGQHNETIDSVEQFAFLFPRHSEAVALATAKLASPPRLD